MAHGDITHVDIPVSDNARASAFYNALFGWQMNDFGGMPMWQAPNEISGGMLAPRSEGFTQPRSTVEVDSIEDTLALAVEHGGKVLAEKTPISETSWWAIFEDPDGNHIGIYEGVTDASTS